jgi:hypothetical protein
MKIQHAIFCLAAIAFAGCAQVATVTVIKPHLVPGLPKAGADRLAQQLIRRAPEAEKLYPLRKKMVVIATGALIVRC